MTESSAASRYHATALLTWFLLSLLLCWGMGLVASIGPLGPDAPARDPSGQVAVAWVVTWILAQVGIGVLGLLLWLQWRAPRARRVWLEAVRTAFLVIPVACLGAGLALYLDHHQVTWSQTSLLVQLPLATTGTVTLVGYGAVLAVRLQRPIRNEALCDGPVLTARPTRAPRDVVQEDPEGAPRP